MEEYLLCDAWIASQVTVDAVDLLGIDTSGWSERIKEAWDSNDAEEFQFLARALWGEVCERKKIGGLETTNALFTAVSVVIAGGDEELAYNLHLAK
jgi:hypothetical protein